MPSEMKVNKISPASGTGITLGDSGDTFTITSGVTLAGAGTSLTALNATQLTSGTIPIARIADDAVTLAKMADDAIGVAQLSATGTASNSVFLRGDNTWAAAGGGKVLQVVASSNNTGNATTSTSEVDTANTVTITPTLATSKVLLSWSHPHMYTESADKIKMYLYMGGNSQFVIGDRLGEQTAGTMSVSGMTLHEPNTTSAVIFKTTYKRVAGSGTVHSNVYTGRVSMVAIEIGV